MDQAAKSNTNQEQERMSAAFSIVDPTCHPIGRDWKAPIEVSATESAWVHVCKHKGVTFKDVLDSIAFFTATKPTLSKLNNGTICVRAAGYRAGPAGDH